MIGTSKTILVTGGSGFIGCNFIKYIFKADSKIKIINLDKLTYAGNPDSLANIANHPNYIFAHGSINDRKMVFDLLGKYNPYCVVNFAAESHVDRSIDGPGEFIQTNVVGTFELLEAVRYYWNGLDTDNKLNFRFVHVSTDEVYGSLGLTGLFTEDTSYAPNSPYSASKAASDHLVRAYHHTYGIPTLTTNCSNNYGPYQFPEKLIPLMILNALSGKELPIYGDGMNVRDWLYVEDHCRAICAVLERGTPGETYNIGGHNEKANIDIVRIICDLLDEKHPRTDGKSYRSQIIFVKDRPGHDKRYAIDASKIKDRVDWMPMETFESGINKTIEWYLANSQWCKRVCDGSYRGERLGLMEGK